MKSVFLAVDESTERALRLALKGEGYEVVPSLQEGVDIAIIGEEGLSLVKETHMADIPTLVLTIGGMENFVGTLRKKLGIPSLNHGGELSFSA